MKIAFDKSLINSATAEKYLSTIVPTLQEKKVQSFTMIALTLLSISFFGIFAISPTFSTIVDLQKQINDYTFVSQQLTNKITALASLQQQYQIIKPNLPIVYNAIPLTPDLATFVGEVQALSSTSDLSLNNIQTFPVDFTNSTSIGLYNTFTFSLDASGDYTNITQFLSALTSFDRLLVIENVVIQETATN